MTASNMRTVGFLLMSLGFLAGAYFLVQFPARVSWVPYGVTFVVTAIGAALLRVAQSRAGGAAEKVSADIDTIRTSLAALVEKVSAINAADRQGAKLFDVCTRIDDECMDPINDFVDAREAMIHRFGLASYATMMDSFALGERALNRAWCASADGYIDEVDRCLERAQNHLVTALATVESCVAGGQPADATSEAERS